MALGRARGRMSSAAMQQAAQQRAMAQRTPQQRSGLRAVPQKPTAMPKQVAGGIEAAFNAAQNKNTQGSFMDYAAQRAMQQFNQAPATTRAPAQQAQQSPNLAAYNASQQGAMNQFNQMAAFNAAQNKDTQGFNAAQLQQLQQEKMLRERQNQRYLGNPAAMAQLAQAPNNLQNLAAKAKQPKPTPDMSAIATHAVLTPEQNKALMRGEKVTAPPAMRKGGAVKKKPGYAKGGMVMANCGASMKPQQKRKK